MTVDIIRTRDQRRRANSAGSTDQLRHVRVPRRKPRYKGHAVEPVELVAVGHSNKDLNEMLAQRHKALPPLAAQAALTKTASLPDLSQVTLPQRKKKQQARRSVGNPSSGRASPQLPPSAARGKGRLVQSTVTSREASFDAAVPASGISGLASKRDAAQSQGDGSSAGAAGLRHRERPAAPHESSPLATNLTNIPRQAQLRRPSHPPHQQSSDEPLVPQHLAGVGRAASDDTLRETFEPEEVNHRDSPVIDEDFLDSLLNLPPSNLKPGNDTHSVLPPIKRAGRPDHDRVSSHLKDFSKIVTPAPGDLSPGSSSAAASAANKLGSKNASQSTLLQFLEDRHFESETELLLFIQSLKLHVRRTRAPGKQHSKIASTATSYIEPVQHQCKYCVEVRVGGGYVFFGHAGDDGTCIDCGRTIDYDISGRFSNDADAPVIKSKTKPPRRKASSPKPVKKRRPPPSQAPPSPEPVKPTKKKVATPPAVRRVTTAERVQDDVAQEMLKEALEEATEAVSVSIVEETREPVQAEEESSEEEESDDEEDEEDEEEEAEEQEEGVKEEVVTAEATETDVKPKAKKKKKKKKTKKAVEPAPVEKSITPPRTPSPVPVVQEQVQERTIATPPRAVSPPPQVEDVAPVEPLEEEDESKGPKKAGMPDVGRFGEKDAPRIKKTSKFDFSNIKVNMPNPKTADAEPDPLDLLAQFCILPDQKERYYKKVFEAFDKRKAGKLNYEEISAALQYTNQDLLTIQEKRYTLTVLGIVKEHHDYRSSGIRPSSHKFREIDFRHFAVVAALSERIHHLEPWVKDHLCDDALYTKLRRGREIFYCNDPDHSGYIGLENVRIEMKAGGFHPESENGIIDHFVRLGMEEFSFLDFLAYLPLFVKVHNNIVDRPFRERDYDVKPAQIKSNDPLLDSAGAPAAHMELDEPASTEDASPDQ